MRSDNSPEGAFPRYSLVGCVVSAHRDYGLIVEVEGQYRGFVDLDYISHVPITRDDWPRVGSENRGLVLGVTNDGRLRLDLRQDDLDLAERAVDLTDAMSRWAEVRQAVPGDAQTRQRLYKSPDAALLLSWLVAGRGRGAPMAFVWDLVGRSPETIRQEVATTLTERALHGDREASSTITEAYRACGPDLSLEVLARLMAQRPPTAENLTIFTGAMTEQSVLDQVTAWALAFPDPDIRELGERLSTHSSGGDSQ